MTQDEIISLISSYPGITQAEIQRAMTTWDISRQLLSLRRKGRIIRHAHKGTWKLYLTKHDAPKE